MSEDQGASIAVLKQQMQRVESDIKDHAVEAKEAAKKAEEAASVASQERRKMYEKLEEIASSFKEKDSATNKRIDAWENKSIGARWAAGIGIAVVSALSGMAGAALTLFMKYGASLPR